MDEDQVVRPYRPYQASLSPEAAVLPKLHKVPILVTVFINKTRKIIHQIFD